MDDARYKTFWRRVGAAFLDTLVLLPFTAVAVGLESLGAWREWGWLYLLGAAAGSLLLPTYATGYHWKRGQTVGKRIAGVRVVDDHTGGPIELNQALIRSSIDYAYSLSLIIAAVVVVRNGVSWSDWPASNTAFDVVSSWIFTAWFSLELLTALTNERRRAIHDLIAGTVVIKVAAMERDAFAVEAVSGGSGATGW